MIRILCLVWGLVATLPAWSAEDPTWQSISTLQQAMAGGHTSSQALVRSALARIHALDRQGPQLHAVIALNPEAMAQARALDAERRTKGARGPLHGIPVLIKDNIETADHMPTTAGSSALAQNFASQDAPVVAALRAAGAVILGKTNLSEWANFRSSQASSGWSALGGLARNPYVLDRTPCGSSSGSGAAVAAGMVVAALGTETDGSITCPASMNGLVGLKPTVGLLSQRGIVPIGHSQDTAGPLARNVTDVALLMTALVGGKTDYTAGLRADALNGKRIGVLRFAAGTRPEVDVLLERALARLRAAGATLVEVKTPDMMPISAAETTVLTTEFKNQLNGYLAATPAAVKTRSLAQLIEFNRSSPDELQYFGQDLFLQVDATKDLNDPTYLKALQDAKRLAGTEGIDRLLQQDHLDLLVAPTTSPAWRVDLLFGDRNTDAFSTLPAVAGYPHLSVPMGLVQGLPVGLSFIGPANSEALLLASGFAYEQRTAGFVRPRFLRTIDLN